MTIKYIFLHLLPLINTLKLREIRIKLKDDEIIFIR